MRKDKRTGKEDREKIPCKKNRGGLHFFCRFCQREHTHGVGYGLRVSHCWDVESPRYGKTYELIPWTKGDESEQVIEPTDRIENENFRGMCVGSSCSSRYTHCKDVTIHGVKMILPLCKRHAILYESRGGE